MSSTPTIMFVPFDGWSPSSSYIGEGWETVINLSPAFGVWSPWPDFDPAAGDVADGPMLGSHVHTWAAGGGTPSYFPDAQTLFCGSSRRLYTVDPATGIFTDVSRAALYGADFAGWRFASIGNDIWATNWVDAMQRRTNNAGLFADGVTSTFKPCPRFIAPIREHLVGANLSNAGRRQDEIVWSDADNALNFDPPTGTSISIAGSKALVSLPGQITALIGGQYGFAFKESGIFYLEYTGTTQVLRPEVLSATVGTRFPSSAIVTKWGVFFLGPDGFYQIAGISEPQKVSPSGVDQFLFDSAFSNQTYGFFTWREDIQAVGFQAPGGLVGWAFDFGWEGRGNRLALLHNPLTQAWARVDLADEDGEELAFRVPALFSRPYADSLRERTAALQWNATITRYAPLSGSAVRAPTVGLRFRPSGMEASEFHQTAVLGVLPVFSKTSPSGVPLTPSVRVEPLLEPFGSPGATETRAAADRNVISGYYPFQTAGRLFRVTILGAAENFGAFTGAYILSKVLDQ